MQKSEIHVVGAKCFQLPPEGLFDGFKITTPAVFSVFIIHRTEMYLKVHLFTSTCNGTTKGSVGGSGGTHIKEVDAMFNGFADDGFDLVGRGLSNTAKTQAKYTDHFISLR